jgi:hypothetical protein
VRIGNHSYSFTVTKKVPTSFKIPSTLGTLFAEGLDFVHAVEIALPDVYLEIASRIFESKQRRRTKGGSAK